MRKKTLSPADVERQVLCEAMAEVRLALACAHNQFDTSDDPKLTEAAIYRILSLQARYDYLLRAMKALCALPEEQPAVKKHILQEVKSWG